MTLSKRTKTTLVAAVALSLVGAVASAQNLRVTGVTTTANVVVASADNNGLYGVTLARTNEAGRYHRWAWWHFSAANSTSGQDSLQLYEYQTDSSARDCGGNAADGAMCNPRLTIAKGGNVGIGLSNAVYPLDVAGDVRANWFRSQGQYGWYNQTYGGGWFMTDTYWVRSYADKGVWAGAGPLGSNGGLTLGFSGATPPVAGGAIVAGTVGIGTAAPNPYYKLEVKGPVAAAGSEIIFSDTAHSHSGVGNGTGFAAIENAGAPYNALMILGRAGASGRVVNIYDHMTVSGNSTLIGNAQVGGNLQVTGTLKATGGVSFYWCPGVSVRTGIETVRTYCGSFSLSSTCPYTSSSGTSATVTCSLVGRLLNP